MLSRRLLLGASLSALVGPATAAEPIISRIAFGSCLNQESGNQGIWDAVIRYRPQAMIFAGDSVYGDLREGKTVADADILANLREAYEKIAAIPALERLRSRSRTYATWDDHDYGKNDAGADFPLKSDSKNLFLSFWKASDDDLRRSHDGVYMSDIVGPEGMRVQIILLDTRFFRSPLKKTDLKDAPGKERYLPDSDPAKTMLGEEQWTWLAEELKRPAEVRLIVSSIQLVADSHGWEKWGNFPKERERFLRLIADSRANGVIVLSGDRHFGAFYRERSTPYPLIDFTSSGFTHAYGQAREQDARQVGPLFADLNFGTIDIDWWDGSIALQLRNMNGETMRRMDVRFSDLRPK